MPDSAKAASLVSIRAAPPDPASHHLASFWSSPSLRRRYPCLTRVRPAGGRDDRGATRSAAEASIADAGAGRIFIYADRPARATVSQSGAAICTYVPGSNGPGSEKPSIDSTFA
jgi:hypothetical protein